MKPRMSIDEAFDLKDRMPRGLFQNVEKQTADEIWLCAIEATETYHGIRERQSKVVKKIATKHRWKFWALCAAIATAALGARFLICGTVFPTSHTLACVFTIR